MIVWGTRLYGRCDEVEGLGEVATKFFHLWFIPLIPLQTMMVTSEDWDGWRGVPMSLSFKSVLIAWSRTALFLLGIATALFGVVNAASVLDHFNLLDLFGALCLMPTAAAAFVAFWLVRAATRRASEHRTEQLLAACGLR